MIGTIAHQARLQLASEFSAGLGGGEVVEEDGFMTRGLATHEFDPTAGVVEGFRKEFNECLVGSGIDGRGGHFDFQFVAEGFADFIAGGAGLELDRKQSAAGRFAEEGRRRHGAKGFRSQ